MHLPESDNEGRNIYSVIDRKIGDDDRWSADIHIITIRSEFYRSFINDLTDKVKTIWLWWGYESECRHPRAIVLEIESNILKGDRHEASRKTVTLWCIISNIDDLYDRLIIIGQLFTLSNDILISNEEDTSFLRDK